MSSNFKYVVIASVVVLGQGAVWYSGQFWALFYLQSVKKLDVLTSSYIIAVALLIATPTLIFWGWLSDKIGRKPIILGGMLLASLTYYPLYTALGVYADPKTLNFCDGGLHRGDPGELRGHDLRPDRGVPGGVLPLAHPLHLGFGAVPHRQWLGRRSRAHRHHSGLRQGGGGGSSDPLFWALLYPIAVPAIMFLIAIFVMPETRKNSIWEEGAIQAARDRARA